MSHEEDPVLGTVKLPVKEGRRYLWNKTIAAYHYVYEHHLDDADWFMRLDDDNFAIMENVRYMLYQYRPQTSLYFGHRFTHSQKEIGHYEGYMAGGGYVLSKKALKKFVEELFMGNKSNCSYKYPNGDTAMDDIYTGTCLQNHAIFVNEMDDSYQKRFFPAGLTNHLGTVVTPDYWYWKYLWYNNTRGDLRCCSDVMCAIHYIGPSRMHEYEYYVYYTHPFGLNKNLTEKLPKKLSIDEIIAASNIKGWGKEYINHEPVYQLEPSELY